MGSFDACVAVHIPRADNADADMLPRLSHEAPKYISKVARVEELQTACINALPVAPPEQREMRVEGERVRRRRKPSATADTRHRHWLSRDWRKTTTIAHRSPKNDESETKAGE
nr:uncharacterized protein LOC109173510 [Ipomoea batatas]